MDARCSADGCWYTLPVVDGRIVAHSKAGTLDVCEGGGRPPLDQSWRVGRHYGVHVYEGDRPVATFHREDDAARAVLAVNRGHVPDDEFVLRPPRGWLNRIDEVLLAELLPEEPSNEDFARFRTASQQLGDLVRGWAIGLDNHR